MSLYVLLYEILTLTSMGVGSGGQGERWLPLDF